MPEPEPQGAGFVIDGERYEIPSLYSFDMDENKIMFDLSGRPTEDWLILIEGAKHTDAELADGTLDVRNPGFTRAFVHVAYRRRHPELAHEDIDVVVGKSSHFVNWAALFLGGEEGDESDPQKSGTTSKQDEPSPSVSDVKPNTSDNSSEKPGQSSTNDSGQPDVTPEATGTGVSDTSSRRWGRIRSVA